MDELNNYAKKNTLGSTKINGFLNKYEKVISIIRELNNRKIYIIGLYESNIISESKTKKINSELEALCKKYDVTYIDISNIIETQEFFTQKNNYYLNYKGQKYIFDKIKENREQGMIKIV